MAQAIAASSEEIALRREHGEDYRFAGYVLHPRPATITAPRNGTVMQSAFAACPESADDVAAIRAALDAAHALGENLVLVLGHADYYPRFGFAPASHWGITAPFEVPDEAMMALTLDPSRPVPSGVISYPDAFGI